MTPRSIPIDLTEEKLVFWHRKANGSLVHRENEKQAVALLTASPPPPFCPAKNTSLRLLPTSCGQEDDPVVIDDDKHDDHGRASLAKTPKTSLNHQPNPFRKDLGGNRPFLPSQQPLADGHESLLKGVANSSVVHKIPANEPSLLVEKAPKQYVLEDVASTTVGQRESHQEYNDLTSFTTAPRRASLHLVKSAQAYRTHPRFLLGVNPYSNKEFQTPALGSSPPAENLNAKISGPPQQRSRESQGDAGPRIRLRHTPRHDLSTFGIAPAPLASSSPKSQPKARTTTIRDACSTESSTHQLTIVAKATKSVTGTCTSSGVVAHDSRTLDVSVKPRKEEVEVLPPRHRETLLTLETVRTVLDEQLLCFEEDHDYLTKSSLARARRKLQAGLDTPCNILNYCATPDITNGLCPPTQALAFSESPFADMAQVEMPDPSVLRTTFEEMSVATTTHHLRSHKAQEFTISNLRIPTSHYKAEAIEIPPYVNYVTLQRNVIGENERQLLVWPYFGDGVEPSDPELYQDLENWFTRGLPDDRQLYLFHKERSKQWLPYINRFLQAVGCGMHDVLRYLLDPRPSISVVLTGHALKVWEERDMHSNDFDRTNKSLVLLLTTLPQSTDMGLAMAGLASAVFQKVCGFSIWHVAKLDLPVTGNQLSSNEAVDKPVAAYQPLACRVCHMHDCVFHGQMLEDLAEHGDVEEDILTCVDGKVRITAEHRMTKWTKSAKKDLSGRPGTPDFNAVNRNEKLYRLWRYGTTSVSESSYGGPICSPCSDVCCWREGSQPVGQMQWSEHDTQLSLRLMRKSPSKGTACMLAVVLNKPCIEVFTFMLDYMPNPQPIGQGSEVQKLKVTSKIKQHPQKSSQIHERAPFRPCSHEGDCGEARCSCYVNEVHCEKTCSCSAHCDRRFPGCSCTRHGKPCYNNATCLCFQLNRECDEDLCGTCGAAWILNPLSIYHDENHKGACGNISIQRNVPKRTLLGRSQVAGFGLYMGESIKAGEYIGEYKGEVLETAEAGRRGTIYDQRPTSYLFKLNQHQEIDSTLAGNKIRFINNSVRNPNCGVKLRLCNTVTRIGMYALRSIEVGEELFFNYRYPKEKTKHFIERMPEGEAVKAMKFSKKGRHKVGTTKGTNASTAVHHAPSSLLANLATDANSDKGEDVYSHDEEDPDNVEVDTFVPLPPDDSQDEDYIDDENMAAPSSTMVESLPFPGTARRTRGKKRPWTDLL